MKIGDKVIMNDRYAVSDKNKGKVFIVKSAPWDLCGTDCVLLEGYSGGYAVDGLTKIECANCQAYPCGHYVCGLEAWECDSFQSAN